MRFKLILITAVLSAVSLFPIWLSAQNLWQEDGIPLRQADYVQWSESAAVDENGATCIVWSDCRDGLRALYAQKFSDEGTTLWEEGGVLVYSGNGYHIDYPAICASEDGGFIVGWIIQEYPFSTLGIKAQKIDSQGNPLWGDGGIDICNLEGSSPWIFEIVTDGVSGAFFVWVDKRNGDEDIFSLRILANGSMAPGWVENGNAVVSTFGEQTFFQEKAVCPDGVGGIIVAWNDNRSSGNTDIYAQRMSSDGQALWTVNGVPICSENSFQSYANIVSDEQGGAYIVWEDNRNSHLSQSDIYMSHINSDGIEQWAQNGIPVCTASNDQEYPKIIEDGSGGAYIAWEHNLSEVLSDIYAQRVDFNGNILWQNNGIVVCNAANRQTDIEIVLSNDSNLAAVWRDGRFGNYPQGDIYSQLISNTGEMLWQTNGILISDAEYLQSYPVILSTITGDLVYYWNDARNDAMDLYTQRVDEMGNPQFAVNGIAAIEGLEGSADAPFLLNLPNDMFFAVWSEMRSYLDNFSPAYFQIFNIDGNCIMPEDGAPLVENTGAAGESDPQAALTSDGCAVVAWRDDRITNYNSQIYAQKVDSQGNLLWNIEGIRIFPSEYSQSDQYVCSDEEGGAFIAFSGYTQNWDYKVYVQRVDADGNLPWGEDALMVFEGEQVDEKTFGIVPAGDGNAILVSQTGLWLENEFTAALISAEGDTAWTRIVYDLAGYQEEAVIIPSIDGGAIIAWADRRNETDYDIYIQKVDTSGHFLWEANGRPVINMDEDQRRMKIFEDEDGFIHVVWEDDRNYVDENIYYQKLTSDGSLVFPEEGILICGEEGDQTDPAIALDGAGGVMISWSDSRNLTFNNQSDLYALHLDSEGHLADPVWNEGGNPVCEMFNSQVEPIMISDGFGGAVIAWEDGRSSGVYNEMYNIYAQRVNDFSVVWAKPVTSEIPAEFSFSQNYPNPFNPSTTFSFSLPKAGKVQLKIFDITGREVARLVDGMKPAGSHQIVFDGSDLTSGVYFARLEAGEFRGTRKMLLIK